MRKVAFIQIPDESRKVMIYQSHNAVFLFGYDCIQDTSSSWDNWFLSVEDAEIYCREIYNVCQDDWIIISDPIADCQVDIIAPTKLKTFLTGRSVSHRFRKIIHDRSEETNLTIYKTMDGLTGNERLFVTGLMEEFEEARVINKEKARKILAALKFDALSIENIIEL